MNCLHMRRSLFFCFLLVAIATGSAHAQQRPDSLVSPRPQTPDSGRHVISPRAALIRSLIIPGWGQASVGAYKRAGFFFAAQSASWYMLIKTLNKLSDARDIERERVDFTSDTLRARMALDTMLARVLSDPAAFDERVGTDADIRASRGLIDAREEQRQDWITYTLFFTFASGVDAYIAAQLADFPATIEARPARAGGMQLQVNVPLRRRK